MTEQMDPLDKQILQLLRLNGRLSNREIARTVGVSEGTVRTRIKRLEDDRVMRIMAVTDPFRAGRSVWALVGLKVDRRRQREVAEELRKIEDLSFLAITFGLYDIVALVLVETRGQLREILSERIAKVPGVRRTETTEGLETLKYTSVARLR
jgi:Lrp/AsnC family transcriptional regulator, regulator for asnA, asnC and gidA